MREFYHLIFATKSWKPIITEELGQLISNRLIRNFNKLNVEVLEISSQPEHFHILIAKDQGEFLSKSVAWTKGECSHWINKERDDLKFYWQKGYKAFPIVEGQLESIKKYITEQDLFHEKTSLYDELEQLMSTE